MKTNEQDLTFKSLFLPFTTRKAIIFIVIIGIVIFFNGLFNGFVGDDQSQVTENKTIQSVNNIPSLFSGGSFYNGAGQKPGGYYYKPLLSTSYTFTYALVGYNSFVFHFFQIFLYIINACVLFLVLKRFFNKSLAYVLSVIFLIHPINSEVAFYISAAQEVLFFFFGIISLWIIQNYKSQKALIIAAVLLLCSLLSKETGALFLCISIIYTLLYKRRFLYFLLGVSAIALSIYGTLRIHAIGFLVNNVVPAPIERANLLVRLVNMPAIFLFYLKTFLFPLNLSISYHWVYRLINISQFFIPLIIDILFLAVICLFAFILYKRYLRKYFTLYVFFSSWFLLGMLFHLQIFPLDQTVAERWFYFPIVGLLGMIGVLLEVFHVNLKNKWVVVAVITIAILFSFRTIIRSFDWRNNVTLVSHDIKVSKDSYSLENELSHIYLDEGRYEEAKIHAEKSIQLFPYNVVNYTSLGNAYFRLGDYKQAKIVYLKALQYGDYYIVYENLAVLATNYGNPSKDIEFIKNISLKKYPQDAKLWLYLAALEYIYGNKENAQFDIEKAYSYNQEPQTSSVYYTIINNQPLEFKK